MRAIAQSYQPRSLLDDPIVWIVLISILILGGIAVLIIRISQGKRLRKAQGMLDAGLYAEAHAVFLRLARERFEPNARQFLDKTLAGLQAAYAGLGITADLQPVRQLRDDLDALRSDKSMKSVLGNSANDNLNREGAKIKEAILAAAKDAFDALPPCGPDSPETETP